MSHALLGFFFTKDTTKVRSFFSSFSLQYCEVAYTLRLDRLLA